MNDKDLQIFIDNYTSVDFDSIKLKWNGKCGHDFKDENIDFRTKLCEFILLQIDKVNLELIRDIYCETGKTSPLTFEVYRNFHLFADELLKRGGRKYLLDYIRGASHSMDTKISSGILTISKDKAKELLEYFDELKSKTTNAEENKLLDELFRKRFEYHANK